MDIHKYEAGSADVIVVGIGHAGCEAGLATSRLGLKTLMFSVSLDNVAAMSCNPNIGGTGKGHLVREIDALGGEMAINIDKTFIQSRMLNTSKGPAVHSLRVQADKKAYMREMKKTLENQENLDLIQGEIVEILTECGKCVGVVTRNGGIYRSKAVILATGTYLRGKVFIGEINYSSGPDGHQSADLLSESMKNAGFELRRMKTGTPARVHRDSIDFSVMEEQKGDEELIPFSFMNLDKDLSRDQVSCYLTYTSSEAHEIIRENLHRSGMYTGVIEGTGPRYCPSIEDKVVRFSDRDEHQVFIEPEGLDTKEMYVQGVSSSLPEEVQKEIYKRIKGLENVKFMRTAYAIEYDAINPLNLKLSLEHRKIENLFTAGQINGSSGYEEAAAQGLIAGINAAQKILGKEALILDRSEAYIGVLIDDLVTKGTEEPYRMMTSRAEYRLTLRQDNADLRLTEKGYKIGLVSEERYRKYLNKKLLTEEEIERLSKLRLNPSEETNKILKEMNTAPLTKGISMKELLRRPEITYDSCAPLDPERPKLVRQIRVQVETEIKYEGYIEKQMQRIAQFKKLESKSLSPDFDYSKVLHLSNEARQKLNAIKPESVGQASRISGVSPADINMLLIYLEQERRKNNAR